MIIPYENTLIGYFLYYLGHTVAKHGLPLSYVSPNLLQQTPLDHAIGDMMMKVDSKYLIIEFKRENKYINSERKKKQWLLDCLQNKSNIFLSTDCHYLSFGGFNKNNDLDLFFYPYIFLDQDRGYYSEIFFDKLINNRLGAFYHEFRTYLDIIIDCSGEPPKCQNCAIIEINEDGKINVIALQDFRANENFATVS